MTHEHAAVKQGLAILEKWVKAGRGHYTGRRGMQHSDWLDNFLPDPPSYYLGCVSKYLARYPRTRNTEDLLKAAHYLLVLIGEGRQ